MTFNRRHLLSLAAAAAPALVAGRVWAAPQASTRVLVVFLRGAYDAANVVIPTGSDFYYQARPTLHIAKPDPANADAALPLDADWSLQGRVANAFDRRYETAAFYNQLGRTYYLTVRYSPAK